jgi:hypothetical protein
MAILVNVRFPSIADLPRRTQSDRRWYLAFKAALSGIIIAIVYEVAKRYPGFGADCFTSTRLAARYDLALA